MIKKVIGRINNVRAAQAFADYLKSLGMNSWIEPQSDGVYVYIDNPDDEDLAVAELRDFLQNPSDPKYLDASWNTGQTRHTIRMQSAGGSVLESLFQRAGWVTISFASVSILVTLITWFGSNRELTDWFTIASLRDWQGGLEEILSGQIWRLVTPIFLHFMLLHILFNMMWLWDLGGQVERRQSGSFLAFFIVSTGVLSNLVQFFSTGPGFGGMSGVVYALLGYIWMRSLKANSGYHLNSALVALMIGWLILGYTGILGPIGNAAHLSGLLFGVAYGLGWNSYE